MLTLLAQVVVPDPAADFAAFVVFAKTVWEGGGWVAGIGLALVALTAGLRAFGARWIPFLDTRNGKLGLAVATAAATAFVGGMAAGQGVAASLGLAIGAVPAALGVFSGLKNAKQPNTGK